MVAARIPHASICLLSALQVHALTTEAPHAVWIMIDSKARTPKFDALALEVVRAHGAARAHGLERRKVENVSVSITSAAKTVADCFRYRKLVGLDVALAALREYVEHAHARKSAYTIDALVDAAKADRVYSVLRPYLEALV
jgi:predicted transcriptional regulator of viral defense system